MSIDESISQDPMDYFAKSLRNGNVDWGIYFHQLHPEQQADADQLLHGLRVTTLEQLGSYSVIVARSGIHPGFHLPFIDGETANYEEEKDARGLADYLNSTESAQNKQIVSARVEINK